MSEVDLDAIRAVHPRLQTSDWSNLIDCCPRCDQAWPCDAIRLLNEVERIKEVSKRRLRLYEGAVNQVAGLREAFIHTHVACRPGQVDPPGYPDRCQECGFDIRDPIHKQIARAAFPPKKDADQP